MITIKILAKIQIFKTWQYQRYIDKIWQRGNEDTSAPNLYKNDADSLLIIIQLNEYLQKYSQSYRRISTILIMCWLFWSADRRVLNTYAFRAHFFFSNVQSTAAVWQWSSHVLSVRVFVCKRSFCVKRTQFKTHLL